MLFPIKNCFLEKFVTKYEKQVPKLYDFYQGKLGIEELWYTSAEISEAVIVSSSLFGRIYSTTDLVIFCIIHLLRVLFLNPFTLYMDDILFSEIRKVSFRSSDKVPFFAANDLNKVSH